MFCKNCGNEMDPNAVVCVKCGVQKGQGANFCPNCATQLAPGAAVCTSCGAAVVEAKVAVAGAKSKLVAGLLGIFLGSLGIHNFYLGYQKKALIQLLVSVIGGVITCGVATIAIQIWSLVEAIQILMGKIDKDASGNYLAD